MTSFVAITLIYYISIIKIVLGQTFLEYAIPPSWPGISQTCATALNTTVRCPGILAHMVPDLPRLNPENLTSLCTESCQSSLESVKQVIEQGCTGVDDKITYQNIIYPATYLIDQFLYAYSISCRKDSETGVYCDILSTEWLNVESVTSAEECSDCRLGQAQLQLNSPFGYDDDFASAYASVTSSCSATNYPFTKLEAYSLGTATASANPTGTTPTAAYSIYTIQKDDTCNKIASAMNVSTYSIWSQIRLTSDCDNLIVGSTLRLQGACQTYLLQATDTCESIVAASNANGTVITNGKFLIWNPNINVLCTNLHDYDNTYLCLSRPLGSVDGPEPFEYWDYDTAATDATWPTVNFMGEAQLPIAPGTVQGCSDYRNYEEIETIQDSFYQPVAPWINPVANDCQYVASLYGVLLEDFLSWNPSLDAANCKLTPGHSYCAFQTDYVKPSPKSTNGCVDVDESIIPSGTITKCKCYTMIYGWGFDGSYTCDDIAEDYKITITQLKTWNPWIGADCDTGLYANLDQTDGSSRGVCVAI